MVGASGRSRLQSSLLVFAAAVLLGTSLTGVQPAAANVLAPVCGALPEPTLQAMCSEIDGGLPPVDPSMLGDGFVAEIHLPTLAVDGPLPVTSSLPVLPWDGAPLAIDVSQVQERTGETWSAYSGPLTLHIQRDCGSLTEALAFIADCQGNLETLASVATTAVDGNALFLVAPTELDDVLVPVDVLHVFVEAPGLRYSHYLLGGLRLDEVGQDQADLLEDVSFTPVLLASGAAGPDETSATDGFTALIEIDGALASDGASLVAMPGEGEDVVVHATPFVSDDGAFSADTAGRFLYVLRLFYPGADGTVARFPDTDFALAPDGCDLSFGAEKGAGTQHPGYATCAAGTDGRYTWSIALEDLPVQEGLEANGFQLQVQRIDEQYAAYLGASHLLLPKDAILANAGIDAAPAADVLDGTAFSPLFVLPGAGLPGAGGDGFVALFDDPLPPGWVWDGVSGLAVAAQVSELDGEAWVAYDGPLDVLVQRDCGSLEPALALTGACQPAGQLVSRVHATVADGALLTTVPAADLADLFVADVPVSAVHLFLETPDFRYAHVNLAAQALLSAAGSAPAEAGAGAAAMAAADGLEAVTFTPLVVANAAALPTPNGDGFVAAFGLGDGAPVSPPVVAWDGVADLVLTVDAQELVGDAWTAYEGSLVLYAQRDCGALEPVLGLAAPCQAALDVVASDQATATGGAATFTLTAADLADALRPADVLHVFVETPDLRYSHYNTGKEAVLAADAGLADALEDLTFTPVVLAAAGPPSDLPAGGDGFVAHVALPSDPAVGIVPAILAGDVAFTANVYTATGLDGAFEAADGGSYNLVLQVDCGELRELALEAGVACAGGSDVTTQTETYPFTASPLGNSISVPAADLETLLAGLPVTALHVFVEGTVDGAYAQSNFAVPTAALLLAGEADAAGVVDLVDATLWHPVVLVGAGAPDAGEGDGFVAAVSPPLPAPVAVVGEEPLVVTVKPTQRVDGAYVPYTGRLELFVQLNCGVLTPVLSAIANCQDDFHTIHSTSLAAPTDGAYTFTLQADDLAMAFEPTADLAEAFPDGYPLSAVNLFVADDRQGTERRYSSFSLTTNALVAAGLHSLADVLEDGAIIDGSGDGAPFTPLVLVRAALPPLPQVPPDVYFPPTCDPEGAFDPEACVPDLLAGAPEPDTEGPLAPTQFEAEGLSETTIELTWVGPADADHFILARRPVPALPPEGPAPPPSDFTVVPAYIAGTETSFVDAGLTVDSDYEYRIYAVDAAGNDGDAATTVGSTLPFDTTPPSAVPNVDADARTPRSIRVTWGAATDDRGVSGYQVWDAADAEADEPLFEAGAAVFSWTETGLEPGTTRTYQVRAVDAAENLGPLSPLTPVHARTPIPTNRPVDSGSGSGDSGSGSGGGGGGGGSQAAQTTTTSSTTTTTPPAASTTPGEGQDDGPATPPSSDDGEDAADLPAEPPAPEPADVAIYNRAIGVAVERSGDANVVRWVLPEQPPAPLAGVQVWRSNSPYVLVGTYDSDSPEFQSGRFEDGGDDAKPTTSYLVTAYFGLSKALGFYEDDEAPDVESQPGIAAQSAGTTKVDPTPRALVVTAWILGAVLVALLVVLLVTRGRRRQT